MFVQEVFQKQIDALQQMDFSDSATLSLEPAHTKKIRQFIQKNDSTELSIETTHLPLLEQLSLLAHDKTKSGTLLVHKKNIEPVLQQSIRQAQETGTETIVRFSNITLQIKNNKISITGPALHLQEFRT